MASNSFGGSGSVVFAHDESRAILEGTNEAFVSIDRNGCITEWNAGATNVFGYERDSVIGRPLTATIIPPEMTHLHETGLDRYLREGTPHVLGTRLELPAQRADGTIITVEATINALPGDQGFFAFLHDITSRKQAETALAESNALMQAILDNTSAVVFAKDLDGRYLFVNAQYESLFGVIANDMVGKTDDAVLPHDAAESVRANDAQVVASGESLTLLEHIPTVAGVRQFVSTKFPIRDSSGAVHGVCGMAIDDTERIRNQTLLEESERRYEHTIANVPGMVYRCLRPVNGPTTFPYISAGSERILGYPPESVMADASLILANVHEDDRESFAKAVATSGETMSPWQWEGRIIASDGTPRWVQGVSRPHRLTNGDVIWDGVLVDHTEEKRAQQALLESQASFNRVIAQLRDYIFTVEVLPSGDVVSIYASPDSTGIFGGQLDTGGNLATAIASMVHSEDLSAFAAFHERASSGVPAEVECRIIGMDDKVRWIWTRLQSRQIEGHVYLDGICSDVTERHLLADERTAAVEALSQSEERFRSQFHQAAVGQALADLDGRIELANTALCEMLGTQAQEVLGQTFESLTHFEDRNADRSELAMLLRGGAVTSVREKRLLRKDATIIDVQTSTALVRAPDGRPLSLVVIVQDITARRVAERQRDAVAATLLESNQELEEANQFKLDLIGMLSHDIGNPLTVIKGYAEVALDGDVDDFTHQALELVAKNAKLVDDIRRQALTMCTIDADKLQAEREPVAILDALQAVVTDSTFDVAIHADSTTAALVHPVHFAQVIGNFLSNAVKYGGGATKIVAAKIGDSVEIRVFDEGPGIDEAFRPKLFERFTRESDGSSLTNGTGLGMFIVKSLAEANGGYVWHEHNQPQGSIFVLRLQAA